MIERGGTVRPSGQLAPALTGLLLLLAAGGCGRTGEPAADPANAATGGPLEIANLAEQPAVPAPVPPLDRAQLMAAAAAATDAVASGEVLPPANAALVGRSFEIRLPFGCDGPLGKDEDAWAGWTYDAGTRALKLHARSTITQEVPWLRDITGERPFETVEGFWIERPWTRSEGCPPSIATAVGKNRAPVAHQTLGIAQFFAPDAPRTLQRGGRPYTITVRDTDIDPTQLRTYRLVLSGRVAGFADKQPVHCRREQDGLPPTCVIAVEFTRVAFENSGDGAVVSEWRR